jgi:hypothetical protein
MVAPLLDIVSGLTLEQPLQWRNLRVTPLRLGSARSLDYVTLADPASERLVTIEETSAGGSVPQLRVSNRAKSRVLIPEGSTLIGAKQNRVVNLSVLLAPESVTVIPVSCVERGRWRFVSPQFAAGAFADGPLRAEMCKDATCSLKSMGKVAVNQGKVWAHVDEMLAAAGAGSPTAAYHALYEKCEPDIGEFEGRLRLPAEACGAAVEIDGVLETVDLFDKPSTLHALWGKMLRSYALSALRSRQPEHGPVDVRSFLDRALRCEGETYQPVGVGTNIRFTSEEAVGAALVCDGQLVHLSLFANRTPPVAVAPSPVPPVTQCRQEPLPTVPRKPWWKFWA